MEDNISRAIDRANLYPFKDRLTRVRYILKHSIEALERLNNSSDELADSLILLDVVRAVSDASLDLRVHCEKLVINGDGLGRPTGKGAMLSEHA